MSKLIKSTSDLPGWYSLEKYAGTSELDAAAWFEQIWVRRAIADAISTKNIDSNSQTQWTRVQQTPIIDSANNRGLRELTDANYDEDPIYALAVYPLTLFELWRMYESLRFDPNDDLWILEHGAAVGSADQSTPVRSGGQVPAYEAMTDLGKETWGNVIRVDLALPEKILVDQFRSFIRASKDREAGAEKEKTIKSFGLKKWAQFGLLPYCDLSIWALEKDKNITNRVMADAIFSQGDGGEEVVRKTTSKIADSWVFTRGSAESYLLIRQLASLAAMDCINNLEQEK